MKNPDDFDPLKEEMKRARVIASSIGTAILLTIAILTGSGWVYAFTLVSTIVLLQAIFSKIKDSGRM